MPQLSLYLDDATMDALKASSQREGLSLSKYAGRLIRSHSQSGWPVDYWGSYGSLDDETFVVPDELDFAFDGSRAAF